MSEQRFDPMTGKPINQNSSGQQPKADKNMALVFVLAGIAVVLLLAIILLGAYVCITLVGSVSSDKSLNQNTHVQATESEVAEPEPIVSEESETIENVVEDETAGEEEETKQENSANTKQIDPNSMYAFRIGEEQYQPPCKVSEFLDRGWRFFDENDGDVSIKPGDYDYSLLDYGGENKISLSVTVRNLDDELKSISDCYVTEVSLDKYFAVFSEEEITTHDGDIVLGKSTRDDVIAAFGEPDMSYDVDDKKFNLYEEKEDHKYVKYVSDKDGIIDEIIIGNDDLTE